MRNKTAVIKGFATNMPIFQHSHYFRVAGTAGAATPSSFCRNGLSDPLNLDGLVKSDLFRRDGIFAESNKHD